MKLILYLAAGGVVGTLARYGAGVWVPTWAGTDFPWATFLVNASGTLLLAFVYRGSQLAPVSPEVRGMITIGFCGAFTTFSTFSYETLRLLQDGAWVRAGAYAFGSLATGLVMAGAGVALANFVLRAGA